MKQTWEEEVVYQIYPRSFCDSNGDGVGDIPGIISKLDYLASLGVKILWLSPIYKSPLFDMGYDVADYYSIHEQMGTMEDFDRLLSESKKRGMKIVMDLVVNHTSNEHEWFKKALRGEAPYHDYYVFRKGKKKGVPPNNWTSMFTGPAWEYVPELDEWYLHLYDAAQPDLNWHNPAVKEEVKKILRFYLDKGVYGFRCDVINQIYKESYANGKGLNASGKGMEHYLSTEGNHRILQELYRDVFSAYPDHVVIGETLNVDIPTGERFLRDHELDMFFTFEHMNVDKALGGGIMKKFRPEKLRKVLFDYQQGVRWNAIYFENHDQLRSLPRFGNTKEYRDISAKALATLLLTLKGTPFIYQGQELGMLNAPGRDADESLDCACRSIYKLFRKSLHIPTGLAKKMACNFDRDRCRAPMAWSAEPGLGFTSGKAWLPFAEDDGTHNVASEEKSEDSVLAYYRKLIRLRRERIELHAGEFDPLDTRGSLFAYRRVSGKDSVLIMMNLSEKPLALPRYLQSVHGKVLLQNYSGKLEGSLPPYGAAIIALE